MAFEQGDVVQYKSGGQKMTVLESNKDRTACEWMKPSGTRDFGEFDTFLLKLAGPTKYEQPPTAEEVGKTVANIDEPRSFEAILRKVRSAKGLKN